MHSLLAIWIARCASSERFRKASAEDYQWHFAWFFFAGVLMIVGTILGRRFLTDASLMSIWLYATIAMVALFFCVIAWAQRVPARVSLALAIPTWGVFVCLALRATHIL
jgi:hypothetical protein